ncbi:MAG TPA: hypothetical protein VLG74_05615 [Blastocatellia bacterium]|nr:hypothetical protein [Blastocatellia bacterium]
MMVIDETNQADRGVSSPPAVHLRILEQMAESLEDQVAALYRRAAAFEEEEFLLTREVEERQTEISRLLLKLESMRAERDRVIERIESISAEAGEIKEEVLRGEEDMALAAIEELTTDASRGPSFAVAETRRGATFFRRMTLTEQAGDVMNAPGRPDPLSE